MACGYGERRVIEATCVTVRSRSHRDAGEPGSVPGPLPGLIWGRVVAAATCLAVRPRHVVAGARRTGSDSYRAPDVSTKAMESTFQASSCLTRVRV